jgi:hypothetical protein
MIAAQLAALLLACHMATPANLCQTADAVELQESSACVQRVSKIDHASAGCMGLHLETARMFDPGVTRYQLIHDNRRNIRDGVAFLVYCKAKTDSWRRMVACYHYGHPAERKMTDEQINQDQYVQNIIWRMKQ